MKEKRKRRREEKREGKRGRKKGTKKKEDEKKVELIFSFFFLSLFQPESLRRVAVGILNCCPGCPFEWAGL